MADLVIPGQLQPHSGRVQELGPHWKPPVDEPALNAQLSALPEKPQVPAASFCISECTALLPVRRQR